MFEKLINLSFRKKEVQKKVIKEKSRVEEEKEEIIPVKKIKIEKEDLGYKKAEEESKPKEVYNEENNMIILTDSSVWKKTESTVEEKSREEEFEDYLEDLLM